MKNSDILVTMSLFFFKKDSVLNFLLPSIEMEYD